MFSCLIDNKQFGSLKEMHSYIGRSLKLKISDYYQRYYPRCDLFSGAPLIFDDYGHYFSSFFTNRENMVSFFKQCSKNDAITTAQQLFEARRILKNWKFVPSTVEARLSMLPSPSLLLSRGIEPREVISSDGLIGRFSYLPASLEMTPIKRIFVDTREQKPLIIDGVDTEFVKLDFGDYTCVEPFSDTFFERKSLVDLCGTLSKGYERFIREIARAQRAGAYLVVIVESPLASLDEVGKSQDTRNVKASPSFLKSRIREIHQSYDNVQFVFAKHRRRSMEVMESIMSLGSAIRTQDAQYLLDIAKI